MGKINFELNDFSPLKVSRVGKITGWGDRMDFNSIQTPTYMVYTRLGHIPHLTSNVVAKHLRFAQTPIYQITLPSMISLVEPIRSIGGVTKFCVLPTDSLTHLSILDPLGKRDPGFNDNSSISVWTSGGRKRVTPEFVSECLDAFGVDSFSTPFDYDTPRDCFNKRLTKANNRTIKLCDKIVNKSSACVLSLGGGFSSFHRRSIVQEFAARPFADAFSIDASMFALNERIAGREPFDSEKICTLLGEQIAELPDDKLRLVEGSFDPDQVFTLINLGIDLFDSSYATWLTEHGKAFLLAEDYPCSASSECQHFTLVDFSDKSLYQDDFSPIFSECGCYSCSKFTRAYVQHLWNTKEMLGHILLAIHNMHETDRMFKRIREHLASEISKPK